MLDKFKEYQYFKKSKSELETDKVINNLSYNLWKNNGYNTAYYLGTVNQLKAIAKSLRESDRIGRNEILALINHIKTMDEVPNEIKNLINVILDEFDYKKEEN